MELSESSDALKTLVENEFGVDAEQVGESWDRYLAQ
jgi:hypothetical protein